MNPIVTLWFNQSIILINRLSPQPSLGSSDNTYFSANPGWHGCLFSRSHYRSLTAESHWQTVETELMILITEMKANTLGLCCREKTQCGVCRCVVCVERSNCEQSARGLNSIKFIDYLSLLHDNNTARHYPTCPPSSLCWQFLRLRPQQTADLLALGTNGSKHRRGFKVVCNIRFLLAPRSRLLTFQNKQIPSHLRAKSKVDKVGALMRWQQELLMSETYCMCAP